ncbi:hypothetical protein N8083_00500 [Candidatus Pacebacteria bacterium]|nr:hypothetical protein [Candidatus Paceibacterota bacterium]
MSVDELRNATKDFSEKPISEIEEFLIGVQDMIRPLEFTDSEKRKLNLVYHRCWSFRDNLIKKYYLDGEVFTKIEPHIYPEHRLSSDQDVKQLLKSDSEYRDSVLIPDILTMQSEETLKFLDQKRIEQTNEDYKLHLEPEGDFWYLDRVKRCYQARGKQLELLRFLLENPGAHSRKDIVGSLGINSEQQVTNKVGILRDKIKHDLALEDVIVTGEDGNGYRISPKYEFDIKSR